MTLDVIIPTRDRPTQLAATLTALTRQTATDFGVVVVDDGGSTPAESAVPPNISANLDIRFLRNDTARGPGPSRNRGIEASSACDIVLIDDDCLAVPQLIERHRAALQRHSSSVSLGPILSPPGQRLAVWNQWDADRLAREYARLADGSLAAAWHHLYTGNVGLRRADFVAVGGFDARFRRQEDMELGYRLGRAGCRFVFDAQAVVFHDSDRTLESWQRIPAASARFDVLMDRLDADSDRLSSVQAELRDKHWALRLVRSLIRTAGGRQHAARAAMRAGRLLHGVRADRAGMAAMSVVWDLTYCEALREAMLDPEWSSR
ncbi:Glycosyltransferase, GT2 family [Mycolicibacterium rutilum]|uniref:Glycosyltransferase, GT2 family n=1 Tax=Mycolicibacterium rutilum TaxID=370526 RepID=A0A1H6IUM3_MYCRU|nr:glycosyltransferase [Mycolicibacterium rutilum]SEH50235.1 Glycosyltransferase, GT2 family [Mycolicibacterium rutilum]